MLVVPGKNEAVVVTEGAVVRALNAGAHHVRCSRVARADPTIRSLRSSKKTLRAVMRGQREDAYSDAPDGATEAAG